MLPAGVLTSVANSVLCYDAAINSHNIYESLPSATSPILPMLLWRRGHTKPPRLHGRHHVGSACWWLDKPVSDSRWLARKRGVS